MIQYILITTLYDKFLRMHLDTKLKSQEHLDNIISKADKTIGLLHKLQAVLPRPSLVTFYKVFIKPNRDYGDIIYDQAYKESFHQKLEPISYNAALAIIDAIRETLSSRKEIYQELGLEFLQKQRWYIKLYYFLKIFEVQTPDYLSKILLSIRRAYNTRNVDYISCFDTRQFFRNSFFPSTLIEWNNLDSNIRNSESYAPIKKSILRFIRPSKNPILYYHNPGGIIANY